MELLCPNCQKKLTVPEQYAGQLMRCPLCQGTFTVPAMPSTVAAEAAEPFGGLAPPKTEPYGVAPEPVAATAAPLPPISAESPSAPSTPPPFTAAAASPATPSAGYSRVCAMKFNPHVIQWLPLGFVLAFLFTFFPWVSGYTIAVDGASLSTSSFNAWTIGFGDVKHALVILFDLLIIFAALLAIASLLFTLKLVPDVPALKPFLPMRSLIVGAIGGLAWLFLTLQLVIWLFSGRMLIPLNFWGWVAWKVTTIALVGAFLEFWLEKRGSGKAWPRMTMEW
jgi:hypothetical protein